MAKKFRAQPDPSAGSSSTDPDECKPQGGHLLHHPAVQTAAPAIREREWTIPGNAGRLFRRSIIPSGDAWARLMVVHGYGEHSGRHLPAMRWLAARGVACEAFDFRGQGRSEGRRGFVRRWGEHLDDLETVLADLPNPPALPWFLLGQSHGALVAAGAVLSERVRPQGCILVAPYFRLRMPVPRAKRVCGKLLLPLAPWIPFPSGIRDEWMTSDPEMLADSRRDPLVVSRATPGWFFGALDAQERILAQATRFHAPLLLVLGDADPVVDPQAAREFFRHAGSADKQLLAYPDLLHEPLRERKREAVYASLHAWLAQQAQDKEAVHRR